MRLSQAVRLVAAVGLVSLLITICLWSTCTKQDGHPLRHAPDAVVSDFESHFNHRGTNSIKTEGGGGVEKAAALKYHEMECMINDDFPVKCRREQSEVYMPFSFIQNYFEVHGKLETSDKVDRLKFQHANSKVHPPRQQYTPRGVFMAFEFYHVEERDRVKCVSAIEDVPFSTQWSTSGHFYPIQIAQYGLSHYSKQLAEGGGEGLVLEDGEEDDPADWARPDRRATITLVKDLDRNTGVMQFTAPDSLRSPGLVMMADEKEEFVMTLDLLFTSNGSLTVTVETPAGQTIAIHYIQTSTLISTDGTSIFYGLGQRRGHWMHLARNIKIDLQKGLSLKFKKSDHSKAKGNFGRIKDISVRGQGRLDNLTLSRSAHMDHFYAAADWLVKHQDSRGGWPIMVQRKLLEGVMELPPGWYSAMAQGQAMSLLVRAHLVTNDDRYLKAAVDGMKLFEISSEQGGILAKFMNQLDWYEEYPTTPSSFVLNGFIYSLLGLYDLKETVKGEDGKTAERLYAAGYASLKAMLLMFDTGSDTFYDLRHLTTGLEPNRARWDYHTTHINQLLQLIVIHDDPLLKSTVQRWMGYMKGRRARHN